MFDPFEPDSLMHRKDLTNRKTLLFIFVPLLVFSVVAITALYMSTKALDQSYTHPECACKRIARENNIEGQRSMFVLNRT